MIKHRYMAAEMYFKVKKEPKKNKCRLPWLTNKENFLILDALGRLKQQYFNLDVSCRHCL